MTQTQSESESPIFSTNPLIERWSRQVVVGVLERVAKNEYFAVRFGCSINGVPTYCPVVDSYWSDFDNAAKRRNIVANEFTSKEMVYVDIVVVSGKDMPTDEFINTDLDQKYIVEKKSNPEAMLQFALFVKNISAMYKPSVTDDITRYKSKMSRVGKLTKKVDKNNTKQ